MLCTHYSLSVCCVSTVCQPGTLDTAGLGKTQSPPQAADSVGQTRKGSKQTNKWIYDLK